MGASISYKYMNSYSSLQNYRVMTVRIDEGSFIEGYSSNVCTYADDAVGMVSGVSENAINTWREFFRYRPCLVCGDEILGYLDPSDFSKYEDGSASEYVDNCELPTPDNYQSSGLYHTEKRKMMHVFIEIPIMGIKISRDGDVVSISMTDNPNADGFMYYPFYYNGIKYKRLYINTALGAMSTDYEDNSQKLIFDSPYDPLGIKYTDLYTDLGGASKSEIILPAIQNSIVGSSNYHIMTYYQFLLLQCMTILQCKRTNEFDDIIEDSGRSLNSGKAGMFYKIDGNMSERSSGSSSQLKSTYYTFFGIRVLASIQRYNNQFVGGGIITLLDGIKRPLTNNRPGDVICLSKDGFCGSEWDSIDGYVSANYPYYSPEENSEEWDAVTSVVGDNTLGLLPSGRDRTSSSQYFGISTDAALDKVSSHTYQLQYYLFCTGSGDCDSSIWDREIYNWYGGGIFTICGIVARKYRQSISFTDIYTKQGTFQCETIRTVFLK